MQIALLGLGELVNLPCAEPGVYFGWWESPKLGLLAAYVTHKLPLPPDMTLACSSDDQRLQVLTHG